MLCYVLAYHTKSLNFLIPILISEVLVKLIRNPPFMLLFLLEVSCCSLFSQSSVLPPPQCVCGYNSEIMSSSVMYSHCSVCIDLQATLPLSRPTWSPALLLAPDADYILFPKLLKVSHAFGLCFYIVLLMAVSAHRLQSSVYVYLCLIKGSLLTEAENGFARWEVIIVNIIIIVFLAYREMTQDWKSLFELWIVNWLHDCNDLLIKPWGSVMAVIQAVV